MKNQLITIQLYQWSKLRKKQIILFIFCFAIASINTYIYIGQHLCKMSYLKSKLESLYLEPNEVNFNSDIITSQRQFDVVLSYYSEDIDYVAKYIRFLRSVATVRKYQPRFIVYHKNSKIANYKLKRYLNVDIVQSLPNAGREGATYLHHIIQNYDIIANHTLFSQAAVEGINDRNLDDWYLDRLENQFNSSVGYMPLVASSRITNHDCGSHITGNFPRMIQLWSILEQTICPPGGQAVALRGQFLASRKRIRDRPLKIYKYLYDLITANDSHWLHRDAHSIFFKSTRDNPIFGHTIERIWTVLFKCAKPDLITRCQRNECACFDEP